MSVPEAILVRAREELGTRQNADNAVQMAAYLKTDMPFFGVKTPGIKEVFRTLKTEHPVTTEAEWRSTVLSLWMGEERELKRLAITFARGKKDYVHSGNMDIFEQLIRDGAWWDLVDETAIHLVGSVLRKEREVLTPLMRTWIDAEDMWIRRSAIISQIMHKAETDEELLFELLLNAIDEKSFFIRKAIGWALRQYSYTKPDAVGEFLRENKDRLSGLSMREGSKQLKRTGWVE